MTDFAQALKRARAAAGLSQQGMADRMLIPRRTIQDWETEKRTPPLYVKRFVLNELESLKVNDELKNREEKLREARMAAVQKGQISEERRKELQELLDSGVKPAEVFNPHKKA